MHPEVRQENPGNCPKCGMALVDEHAKPAPQKTNWKDYIPLIVVFSLIGAATVVLTLADMQEGQVSLASSLQYFMVGFFITFGGFKLLDLPGFAEGYSTYDLLASRVKAYAYIYPFIEVGFGLVMLYGFHPNWLLWVEFAVMAFSGLGVVIKLAKKEQFQCACLGTVLKVPLTSVTLVEDFGMAALALGLIFLQ